MWLQLGDHSSTVTSCEIDRWTSRTLDLFEDDFICEKGLADKFYVHLHRCRNVKNFHSKDQVAIKSPPHEASKYRQLELYFLVTQCNRYDI